MATETSTSQEVPSPAAVVFTNAYLEDFIDSIHEKDATWDGYVRAGLITEEEASCMKSLDKKTKAERTESIHKDMAAYGKTFASILSKIKQADALQYTLVLLIDCILDVQGLAACLSTIPEVYDNLVSILDSDDEVVPLLSTKALVLIIMATDKPPVGTVEKLLKCVSKLATSEDENLKDLAAQAYGAVLSVKCCRHLFWSQIANYGPPLIDVLKTDKCGLQLKYYALIVFWLLSFELEAAKELNKKCDIIAIVMDVMKTAIKEKIVRVGASLFFNLVSIAPDENINAFLAVGGLPIIEGLSNRKWTDTELESDLQCIATTLKEAHDSMSTFDEYVNELMSGRLRWSPAHKSLDFWKRNAEQFKEDDWKLLKELAKTISTSEDNVALAVASNDIGYVISEVPEGLKVLQAMGTKAKIMEMMAHPDPDVKYQALRATQIFVARAFS
ncbi:armadillo-type protein [Dipodascopsis uninucleata]